MTPTRLRWLGLGLVALIGGGLLLARSEAPSAARPDDDKAIRQAAQAFATAFAKGDATAIANLFTDEGEYREEDAEPIQGKAALAKAYAASFANRKAVAATATTTSIRFLGKDTALEEGTFTVTAADQPANSTKYSALHVRQDGKWLIALLKEWGESSTVTVQDLAWLVGTWESTTDDIVARATYEFADNQAFLRVSYRLEQKGKLVSAGTQIIGVDPKEGQIRSWLFESDGGIGEGQWTFDDGRWVIQSAGTLSDGTASTARNLLTRTGPDSFTYRSVHRVQGTSELPDLGPITVKRVSKPQ